MSQVTARHYKTSFDWVIAEIRAAVSQKAIVITLMINAKSKNNNMVDHGQINRCFSSNQFLWKYVIIC